jgi:DNA polymerase III subunit alpha
MALVPFVPLRVFSAYTMLDGAIEPKAIGKYAKGLGYPAIAVTDRNGLYGVMPFEDGCRATGVQPIIGLMLSVTRPLELSGGKPVRDWLALYAQDEEGYQNLCRLVSASHLDHEDDVDPQVTLTQLAECSDGLIALTAGGEGGLARLFADGQLDAAAAYCDRLQAIFPDRLYIELARRGDVIEEAAEDALIALAFARDLPLVATNPACFAEPDFFEAHDAMLCIANGEYVENDDRPKSSRHAWIKTGQQMRELFQDIPEALANTLVVAQRCSVGAPRRKPILPSIAGDKAGEDAQLVLDAKAGLEQRLAIAGITAPEQRQVYFDRLDFEANVIIEMGFSAYFLIVADFIKWAKSQDIAVGPGRGSGAGSVIAWALTITDLDPLQFGLLFERFLNPERVSMPDFDIDFCETRRGEVIRYVLQKYGHRQVAQIITFGKLKARAVLRDTGRVLQMPYGQIDRLCKLVPNHPQDPYDLPRALAGVPELREEYRRDEQVKRLFDLAQKLEGLPRHSSTHAAGVVIGDRPLSELIPLYRDPRSDIPVTQFDMKFVEVAGLVKFDFLGLKTLSVLQKAAQMLEKRGIIVEFDKLALDDEATYKMLQAGDTVGVFQLESEGMRRTLAAVRPTNFGDIIALVSLYRPGPMDNIPMFGRRKNGEEVIEYPHALLEGILSETYGVFVYQEQVMQAAQILAGYSLGGADLLRRAMGKKVQAEMDQQRAVFVAGCAEHHQIDPVKANELFDLIDKFAGYGFNKSHAAAYALLSYHTGWLKAHHPEVFFAASMCFDMHQTDKLSIFVDDMRRLDVSCLPPSINASEAEFSVEDTEHGLAVRYALAGIKNVGERAMEGLVAERIKEGSFASLDDFANRVDPALLNKRQIENLSAVGAFDDLHANRAGVYAGAELILSAAQSARDMRQSGQGGLFGEGGGSDAAQLRFADDQGWSISEAMEHEKEAFGFYFAAHPLSQFAQVSASHGARSHAEIMDAGPIPEGQRKPANMAVMVQGLRWRESKRGKRFVLVDLSDTSGQFSARCFEEAVCPQLAEWAKDGTCLLLSVELDQRPGDETPGITIKSAKPLEGLVASTRFKMCLEIETTDAFYHLQHLIAPLQGGRGEVVAKTRATNGQSVPILLGNKFRLDVELVEKVKAIQGVNHVALEPIRPHLTVVQ